MIHWNKQIPKYLLIQPLHRIYAQLVDMVGDHHQVPRSKFWVNPTHSIGKQNHPGMCLCQHANGESELPRISSFIAMEPTFQHNYCGTFLSEHMKFPTVSLHVGGWKVGYMRIGNRISMDQWHPRQKIKSTSCLNNHSDLRPYIRL